MLKCLNSTKPQIQWQCIRVNETKFLQCNFINWLQTLKEFNVRLQKWSLLTRKQSEAKNIKTNNNPFWASRCSLVVKDKWKILFFSSICFHVTSETTCSSQIVWKNFKHGKKIVRLLSLYVNLSAIVSFNVRLFVHSRNEDAFQWYRSRQESAYLLLPSNWWPFHDKEEKIRSLQLHYNFTEIFNQLPSKNVTEK